MTRGWQSIRREVQWRLRVRTMVWPKGGPRRERIERIADPFTGAARLMRAEDAQDRGKRGWV